MRNRRATLADVALLAQVSPSAVSRAFTPGGSVSRQMRQRVMAAAETLGFQPNVLARSLMTGRSALIALLANAFDNPYVMRIIDVFTSELQARNLRPLVFNLTGAHDWASTVNLMKQYQIDGVLVASSTIAPEFFDRVLDAHIPTVVAFGKYAGRREMDSVFVDNIAGGRIAAQEFLRRGYRAPAFIGAKAQVSTSHDREIGFRDELCRHGIDHAAEFAGEYSHAAGMAATERLLARRPETDAIFCADDQIGIGALDSLRYVLNRAVPDTGVIGFNDIAIASWPSHPLATLRTHTDQIVTNAIDLLERRIERGPTPGEQRIVSCAFVERASVRQAS